MAGAVRALKELQVRPAGAGVRSELESGGMGRERRGVLFTLAKRAVFVMERAGVSRPGGFLGLAEGSSRFPMAVVRAAVRRAIEGVFVRAR